MKSEAAASDVTVLAAKFEKFALDTRSSIEKLSNLIGQEASERQSAFSTLLLRLQQQLLQAQQQGHVQQQQDQMQQQHHSITPPYQATGVPEQDFAPIAGRQSQVAPPPPE